MPSASAPRPSASAPRPSGGAPTRRNAACPRRSRSWSAGGADGGAPRISTPTAATRDRERGGRRDQAERAGAAGAAAGCRRAGHVRLGLGVDLDLDLEVLGQVGEAAVEVLDRDVLSVA